MKNKLQIFENPDVLIGLFVTIWILVAFYMLVGYLKTDENLRDSEKITAIENQIKNELKHIKIPNNVAELNNSTGNKKGAYIKNTTEYISQGEKSEVRTNLKNELNNAGWKTYPLKPAGKLIH